MAGITNSARLQGRATGRLDKPPFGRRFPVVRWELVALVTILAIAALLRFWDLGARTFHGDEAITAGFSWQLADGRGYIHNPLTHGPFQFLGTAGVFMLLGDSDYTARVLPALFGTALVGLPFFLRGHLGRTGAIVSALLLAVSPTLLYFSRFAREDIYVAFFTLAMFICIWRYLQQPRRLYLYVIAALLALTFATKEVAYIIVALLMVYLNLLAARALAAQTLGEATPDELEDAAPDASQPSHYELLGLANDASTKDIRRAYRRLAKGQHGEGARSIEQAFSVLSDAGKRQSYNRRLAKIREAVGRPVAPAPTTGLVPQLRRFAIYTAFLAATPLLLPFWPFLGSLRRRLRLEVFPRAGHLMMLVGCLTLPLFAAAVEKLPFVGDRGASNPAAEVPVMHATVLTLLAIAFFFGLLWRRQVWLAAAVIFWAIFILFFTTFFTNANGFWTGTWGSLDYWLGQQGVGLGSEPGYYYFMLLPVYEFLPLVFALGTVIFYFLRGKRSQKLIALAALGIVFALAMVGAHIPLIGPYRTEAGFVTIIAAMLVLPMDPLTRFLLYWTLSALFAFTVAGEKMPWLNVHIALPMALLAGRSIGRLVSGLELRVGMPPLRRWAPLALAALSTALAAGLFVLAGAESGPAIAGWLLVAAALLTVLWSGRSFSAQAGLRIAGTALGAALLVFTVRASVLSSWGHPDVLNNANMLASRDRGDTPVEMLDYVQTSPDVPVVRDAIDKVAAASGEGTHLPIVIDSTDDFSWPWAWYLRKYDHLTIQDINKDYTPPPGSVVLAKWQDNSYLKIDPAIFTEGTRYHHRWWFPVDYEGLSSSQVLRELVDTSAWEKWGRYLADRSLPEGLPALDAVVYFPRDPRYSEVLSSTLHKKSQ
jgi:uncharacterized protein (TIGR03663 family)